jgi:hypothetical protein
MATLKYIFQLVNNEKQNPLDIQFGDSAENNWRYCDIDLDGNGAFRKLSKQEATVQSALKCVFTEKQDSGYGTNIYNLVGEKDVIVRRVSLFMDITMSIMAMKGFLDAQAVAQDLSADDLIAAISKLAVVDDSTNPVISRVQMSLQTNSGVETSIGVL